MRWLLGGAACHPEAREHPKLHGARGRRLRQRALLVEQLAAGAGALMRPAQPHAR